jgi:hypothetical protein
MSGITGAGAPTDTLISLINLMADPDAAKTRLAELKMAEDNAKAAHQALVERERAVTALETQLKNLRSKFDADVVAYENDKAQFKTHQQETNAAATARDAALKTEQAEFAERSQFLERDYQTRLLTLRDREVVMQKRERDADTRERSLNELEAQLTRKDRALRAAMAE